MEDVEDVEDVEGSGTEVGDQDTGAGLGHSQTGVDAEAWSLWTRGLEQETRTLETGVDRDVHHGCSEVLELGTGGGETEKPVRGTFSGDPRVLRLGPRGPVREVGVARPVREIGSFLAGEPKPLNGGDRGTGQAEGRLHALRAQGALPEGGPVWERDGPERHGPEGPPAPGAPAHGFGDQPARPTEGLSPPVAVEKPLNGGVGRVVPSGSGRETGFSVLVYYLFPHLRHTGTRLGNCNGKDL